jgi:arginase
VTNTIAIVGSPTALGGFGGMERGPSELRASGLLDRLSSRPRLRAAELVDHGDAPIEAGWAPDPDPVMKNRQRIIDYLPQLVAHVAGALANGGAQTPGADRHASSPRSGHASGVITAGQSVGPHANPDATFPLDTPRLLVLGGDCTSHSGAMAGLKHHAPDARLAIAWFDAHGDFNIPETTPSGNVWGMPFAMLCGRGDPGLVAACDGPTVREEDAALLGGQVLDEQESRMLAASPIAQFGAGMLAGPAGLAALEGWATAVAGRTDGLYVAFDLDAIDASEGVCVSMPEPDGLSVETAVEALRILARTNRIVGFGPTATMRRPDSPLDFTHHVDIVARLTEAALA